MLIMRMLNYVCRFLYFLTPPINRRSQQAAGPSGSDSVAHFSSIHLLRLVAFFKQSSSFSHFFPLHPRCAFRSAFFSDWIFCSSTPFYTSDSACSLVSGRAAMRAGGRL